MRILIIGEKTKKIRLPTEVTSTMVLRFQRHLRNLPVSFHLREQKIEI